MVKFWRWLWMPHFAPVWAVLICVPVAMMAWAHSVLALMVFLIIGFGGEYLFTGSSRP